MTNNKMMNRTEAIETFVRDHMTGDDLATVIEYMNSYDGSFADSEYILMDEFDEIMKEESPMTVARAIHKGIFDPNDDYFKVVYDGDAMALFSADWEEVVDKQAIQALHIHMCMCSWLLSVPHGVPVFP